MSSNEFYNKGIPSKTKKKNNMMLYCTTPSTDQLDNTGEQISTKKKRKMSSSSSKRQSSKSTMKSRIRCCFRKAYKYKNVYFYFIQIDSPDAYFEHIEKSYT